MNDTKTNNESLLREEELFKEVLNQLPFLISVTDNKGEIIFSNEAWKNFFSATIKNLSDGSWIGCLHEDEKESWVTIFRSSLADKKPFDLECRIADNNNNHKWMHVYAKPRFTGDEFAGFIISVYSIHESKLHNLNIENKYQQASDGFKISSQEVKRQQQIIENVFKVSHDLITVYDADMRIIAVNKKVEEALSLSGTDLIGKSFNQLFPGGKDSQSYKDLARAINGELIHNTTFNAPLTKRILENYLIPLRNEEGVVEFVLIVAHDNTLGIKAANELNLANESLEEKNKELERSNKELASFTYVASHDLQEPLRKIQSFGKRILEREVDSLSETGRDYFNRMISASGRMQELIEALLKFSRTATSERNFENTDLNILIEEVKKELHEVIEDKNAIVETTALPNLSVIQFQFKQMVSNIISNSLKYSRPDVLTKISIASDIVDLGGENSGDSNKNIFFKLSIRDNGIGFEQGQEERIFELFHRLHGRSEYSGSGIGLSICKKIAENHGGFIKAEGFPGEGAVFNIFIPLKHQS